MANFMRFDHTVRSAFNDDAAQFANFQQLLIVSARRPTRRL